MTPPLISIITVTYNSAATVQRTIESVKQQNYPNIEYIIVDGASSDNTAEICKSTLNGSNIKFTIISEPDNGIYDAMNKGIQIANGEIVGIINSDDWYESNSISIVMSLFLEKGRGVYYGLQRKMVDNEEYLVERLNHKFLHLTMIPHSATFITADIYRQYGLFNLAYRFVADYELMVRLREKGVPFFTIDHILSNFTIGGASAGYKASLESIDFRYRNGFLTRKSYFIKKAKILIANKYFKF